MGSSHTPSLPLLGGMERGQGVRISLTTVIHAPVERVFDLARSITLHEKSMAHTNEKAIGGITSGLINLGESVTWQAKHLFKTRRLTVQITAMNLYEFFTDEMREGDFKSMKHKHYFEPVGEGTVMIDEFNFTSPYALLGKITNTIFLTNYMKRLLKRRNNIIKEYAETNKWKTILTP